MMTDNNHDDLMTACVHVLNGRKIYHQTKAHALCQKCFNHYDNYGHDKNGHWKIPRDEEFTNLKTVCRSYMDLIKDHELSYSFNPPR